MKLTLLSVLSILTFFVALPAVACPLGPRETELSLARVMRNFGRGTLYAEVAIQKGVRDPADVADKELKTAIDGLVMAQTCVEATFNDQGHEMLPLKARDLSGEKLADYMAKYHTLMREFDVILIAFHAEFVKQSTLPITQRSYLEAQVIGKALTEKVNEAHGLL